MHSCRKRALALLIAVSLIGTALPRGAMALDTEEEPIIEEEMLTEPEALPETLPEELPEPEEEWTDLGTFYPEGDFDTGTLLERWFLQGVGLVPEEELALEALDDAVLSQTIQHVVEQLRPMMRSVSQNGGSTVFQVDAGDYDLYSDGTRLSRAILLNLTTEAWWFDASSGMSAGFNRGNLQLSFGVTSTFRDNGNKNKVSAASAAQINGAIANARSIVTQNNALRDLDKLNAYRQIICDRVSIGTMALPTLNFDAPAAFLYVFDNDPATGCNASGYARAFKILCDLSNWDGDLVCNLATGSINTGSGSTPHVWNLVKYNGTSYLADIASCDAGSVGAPKALFLCGVTSIGLDSCSRTTYSVRLASGKTVHYYYDDQTAQTYSAEDQTPSRTALTTDTPPDSRARISGITLTNNQSIQVHFNRGVTGGGIRGYYTVTNASGQSMSISSVSWESTGVYKLNFSDPLKAGTYTLRFTGEGSLSADFHITLDLSVYRIVDNRHVIIQLSDAIIGCTTAENYSFHTLGGQKIGITQAVSAFREIGGAAPNVFKLTTNQDLQAGTTYVVETKAMSQNGQACQGTIAYFTPESFAPAGTGLEVTALTNNQSIRIRLSSSVPNAGYVSAYDVRNSSGSRVTVGNIRSLGGSEYEVNFSSPLPADRYTITVGTGVSAVRGSFDITLDLKVIRVESVSVIIQLNEPIYGCTTAANYFVHKLNSEQEITAVYAASCFAELGSSMPNVFRIYLPESIVPGQTYIIETRAMSLDAAGRQPCQGTIGYFTGTR